MFNDESESNIDELDFLVLREASSPTSFISPRYLPSKPSIRVNEMIV